MSKKKFSIWDTIAWIVIFGILLWTILKVTGIINTPLLLEYAPIFGAVYLAGWQVHKLTSVAEEVSELKNFKNQTINQIHELKLNCPKNHK
jgi:hypothetical protein